MGVDQSQAGSGSSGSVLSGANFSSNQGCAYRHRDNASGPLKAQICGGENYFNQGGMPNSEPVKVYHLNAHFGSSVIKGGQSGSSIVKSGHAASSKSSGKENRM